MSAETLPSDPCIDEKSESSGLQVSGLVATLLERKNDTNGLFHDESVIRGVAATIFAGNCNVFDFNHLGGADTVCDLIGYHINH